MNPLINMMAKQAVGKTPQGKMLQQFAQFRQQMQGKNANAMIQQMLSSGQINQQQLAQAQEMANQMRGLFKP